MQGANTVAAPRVARATRHVKAKTNCVHNFARAHAVDLELQSLRANRPARVRVWCTRARARLRIRL